MLPIIAVIFGCSLFGYLFCKAYNEFFYTHQGVIYDFTGFDLIEIYSFVAKCSFVLLVFVGIAKVVFSL